MIKGLGPLLITFRDFHFWKEVGSVQPSTFPGEVDNARDGGPFPVQTFGDTRCTAITATQIGFNQDGIIYSPDYQMMKTLVLMNVPPNHAGADPRIAFKVPLYPGLLPKPLESVNTETVGQLSAVDPANWPAALDAEAIKHQKPAYLRADTGPYDVFDNMRSSVVIGRAVNRTIGMATPWYQEWEYALGSDGIMHENPSRVISNHMYLARGYVIHNTKGQLIRGGEPFLKIQSWNDQNWGDNGFGYLSRAGVARQFRQIGNPNTWGSIALTYEKIDPETIDTLKMRVGQLQDILLTILQNQIIKASTTLTH